MAYAPSACSWSHLRHCGAASLAVALIDPANERSIRLALRAGFRAAGETQSQLRFQMGLHEPPSAQAPDC
jgi:RimJ/RimL family protein N-acetyltransferase